MQEYAIGSFSITEYMCCTLCIFSLEYIVYILHYMTIIECTLSCMFKYTISRNFPM